MINAWPVYLTESKLANNSKIAFFPLTIFRFKIETGLWLHTALNKYIDVKVVSTFTLNGSEGIFAFAILKGTSPNTSLWQVPVWLRNKTSSLWQKLRLIISSLQQKINGSALCNILMGFPCLEIPNCSRSVFPLLSWIDTVYF